MLRMTELFAHITPESGWWVWQKLPSSQIPAPSNDSSIWIYTSLLWGCRLPSTQTAGLLVLWEALPFSPLLSTPQPWSLGTRPIYIILQKRSIWHSCIDSQGKFHFNTNTHKSSCTFAGRFLNLWIHCISQNCSGQIWLHKNRGSPKCPSLGDWMKKMEYPYM